MFDVWVPDGAGPFPVYIYAHGGGFTGGSKKRMVLSGPLLANDGVVYVNMHYRIHGGTPEGVTDAINDGIALINYLKDNAEKYKLNPDQIFVGGGSAGGVLFNDIVYKKSVSGIKGVWHWNLFRKEGHSVDFEDPQLLADVSIPVVNAHPDPYPSDNSHSALDAFNYSQANYNAGQSGTFFKALREHPSAIGYEDPYVNIEQIWKDGQWIKDSRDGTDTGERIPNLAEWIYEIIGNDPPANSDYEVWKTNYGITDDLADDDNDGIVNRLEFALGGNPKSSDAEGRRPMLSKNGSVFEYVFHRGVASLDYTLESSLDLDHWELFATVDDSHGLVGTPATVLLPDSQIGSSALFLRLKVENAAEQPPQPTVDPELAEAVAGINAGFENVEVEVIKWPSELNGNLGAMHEFAYVTRPVESTSGKLPLIISLHGGGPNWWVMSLEEQIEISAQIDKVRGYDLAELAGKELIMLEPNTTADWEADELDAMLDYVLENFPDVDTDHVYVMGYSKGGGGTWTWLNESADRFAAAAIGGNNGAGAIDDMATLANLPLWLMVGGDDTPAPGMENRVNQLRAAGNESVEHTVIEGADHGEAGDVFFSSVEMVDWLLGFERPGSTE
ncbi:alpha/beta hydrolase fold domain-containing protein [Pelagicoccus mobilis]|uniref:Alpha/beta hydrolase fold domain-containing protein n=1 Tax=Pelagicoccus mobilis TaxID=415221 RepID=A0A934VNG0_9BACT|nr:alpha/beta hydrolase fold domain-containing protein [Pelagicoccus mobilis]MBK1879906.1 alpha/beta hydrolase fold domain-containing protein [Pelagicoccus mobilis]